MSKGLGLRWDPMLFAGYGALIGVCLAVLEQYCHAFCPAPWNKAPEGDLLTHVLLEVIAAAFVGASLLAAIAAVRNRIVRDR